MEKRKPTKTSRTAGSEKAAPVRRRKKAEPSELATFRHGSEVHELNAGQIHLLHALAQEFPGDLTGTLEPAMELVLESEKPGLGSFFLYKLQDLRKQQQGLEALLLLDA
ncbi:MAG TPA: hypothetical protein V6D05_18925 [Stenomitos sp.]